MRGKDLGDDVLGLDVGITPAYAGKSIETATETMSIGDHPRICGEKSSSMATNTKT